MKRLPALALFFLSSLAYGQTADEVARAGQLYEEGRRLYDIAEYDRAIERFKEAYLLSHRADLLYNVAQAYRQDKRCAQALTFYQSYLREKPDAEDRTAVEARIVEVRSCADEQAKVTPPPKPIIVTQPIVPVTPVTRSSARWDLALAVTGVVLASAGTAVGIVFSVRGADDASQIRAQGFSSAIDSDGRISNAVTIGAFISAGVFATVAIVALAVGAPKSAARLAWRF